MFICVLTELSINSEKNKRSQVKKLSNPIWESIVFLIPPLIKTFTSAFHYLVCASDPLHTHTYKNSHKNKHTRTSDTAEPNVIIEMPLFGIHRNFIDSLTNRMKYYSTTSNTFGTKTGLFSVCWIFSPSFNFIFSDQFIRNFDCFYTTDSFYVERNCEKMTPYTRFTENWLLREDHDFKTNLQSREELVTTKNARNFNKLFSLIAKDFSFPTILAGG